MGIGYTMIKDPDARGRALALLGLTAATPLLPHLQLDLIDADRVRSLILSCAKKCTRAVYHPGHDMWFVHTDALYGHFVQESERAILHEDIAALARWFAQGRDLPQNDLPTAFWIKALSRKEGADWIKDGMDPDQIAAINSLIADFWGAWRDPEYVERCNELRGAAQTEAELDLCDRFNINFYDDVLDPMVILHDLRVGNILYRMLLERSDALPLQHLHRVADAFLATGEGESMAQLADANELSRIRSDIWTIRSA
ncbi:MAG: hypothetical protein ACRCS3_00195 [Paracoccaceae bacterium]